jgi:predicted O-methyltransferase YrrM
LVTVLERVERRLVRILRRLLQLPVWLVDRLPLVRQRRLQLLLGAPPLGPEGAWTAIDPGVTHSAGADPELVELALRASSRAAELHLDRCIDRARKRASPYADWFDRLPGEHYRMLAGLVREREPELVVEIGTYTGASALAFLEASPLVRVVTYDLVPWDEVPGTLLAESDFADGRLQQRLVDISDPRVWQSELDVIAAADLLFVDGPKDEKFEPTVLPRICDARRERDCLLVIDDIRFVEMLATWAGMPNPKLDIGSFGHWSGTGLVLLRSDR